MWVPYCWDSGWLCISAVRQKRPSDSLERHKRTFGRAAAAKDYSGRFRTFWSIPALTIYSSMLRAGIRRDSTCQPLSGSGWFLRMGKPGVHAPEPIRNLPLKDGAAPGSPLQAGATGGRPAMLRILLRKCVRPVSIVNFGTNPNSLRRRALFMRWNRNGGGSVPTPISESGSILRR